MLKFEEIYELNATNIDLISEKVAELFQSLKMKKEDATKTRLSIEESLIIWLEKIGEGKEIVIKSDVVFFRPTLKISCKSEKLINPFGMEEIDAFSKAILNNLAVSPEYAYEKETNVLTYKFKKPRRNPLITSFLVIICSIIIGVVGVNVLPSIVIDVIMDNFLNPLYSKFLDILRCIAGPLIFFSVAWGIYGIGDTATLTKLGKGITIRMVGVTFLATVCCVPLFWVFNTGLSGEQSDFTQIFSLFSMFLGMIPSTIIEPFSSGNTLQIIVLSVVVGIALLYLGKRTKAVAIAVEQINLIVTFTMELISRLVPYFIAIVLVSLIWSGSINILADTWKFVLILIGCMALLIVVFIAITSIKHKMNPLLLIKKLLPAYLVALTTASSSASFGIMTKTCQEGFGISKYLTGFGIPLGIIMQKSSSAINAILIAFFIGGIFNVECSISWIIMAVIVATITAIATPPIPGGGTIAYTMILTQMGISLDGLAIVLAVDMITDFLITAANMTCVQLSLINIASHFNMIDKEKLLENKKISWK